MKSKHLKIVLKRNTFTFILRREGNDYLIKRLERLQNIVKEEMPPTKSSYYPEVKIKACFRRDSFDYYVRVRELLQYKHLRDEYNKKSETEAKVIWDDIIAKLQDAEEKNYK